MTGGPTAGDVVQFLFVPKALSWYFLPILAALFCFGTFRALIHIFRLRARLEAVAVLYRGETRANYRLEPRAFLAMSVDDGGSVRAVEIVPSLLVTTGILATFMGLGLSLQLAAGSMSSPDSALASLDALLGTVAFKFQTSAWGILLSAVYQVSVAALHRSWVERERDRIERKMLVDYRPAGEAVREALLPLLAQLQQSTDSVGRVSAGMQQSIEHFRASIGESTRRLEGAMAHLDGLGKRLDGAIDRMGTSVAGTLRASVEEAGRAQAAQAGALQAELGRVRIATEELGASIGRLDANMAAAIKKMGSDVGSQLDGSIARQQREADAMNAALGGELAKVAAAIGHLSGGVGEMRTELTKSLGGVERAVVAMGAGQERAMKGLDVSLGQRLAEVRQVLGSLSASTEALDRNLNLELGKLRADLGGHLGATKLYIADLATTMAGMKVTMKHFEQHLARLATVLERVESKEDADIDLGLFAAADRGEDASEDGAE